MRLKSIGYSIKILLATSLTALFLLSSSSLVIAASLAQGYHSAQSITAGAVVSLTKSGSNEVQVTDLSNESLVLGVAVTSSNAIVDLQPSGSDVRVAISGEIPVLVSNIGGDIKTGDNLVISNLSGIAMKDSSTSNAKKYIGVASQSFNAGSEGAKQLTAKVDGQDKQVYAGLIKVKLLFSDRLSDKVKTNPVLSFIQNIIGRPVNTAQLIGSVAVFITTFSFTGLLLNGSIKGAFVSLGRNPLSKPAIISNMARVSILSLLILIAGMAMAYVILII